MGNRQSRVLNIPNAKFDVAALAVDSSVAPEYARLADTTPSCFASADRIRTA
jgi:hypothetical protein